MSPVNLLNICWVQSIISSSHRFARDNVSEKKQSPNDFEVHNVLSTLENVLFLLYILERFFEFINGQSAVIPNIQTEMLWFKFESENI